jgi:7-cyano-7-deazaguanine synthase in queuosine biosynthesis
MKTVVMVSGGIDSSTLVYFMMTRSLPEHITPLYINYGQFCGPTELQSITRILDGLGLAQLEIVDISSIFSSSQSLLITGWTA